MYKVRIIPRLDIKGPNLVKGIHLEGLRVLGSPDVFSSYYYELGADEIFYMDSVASLYERNSLDDVIRETAKKTFIPLTVGGGIRTVDDIRRVLKAGADKVCINTAAMRNPSFISDAAKTFGSSTIVVAIEAIRQKSGQYLAYTDNGRQHTGVEVFSWAKTVESMGAGEIVITSVDKEGTGSGFDLELIKGVRSGVNIPVIAHGGACSVQDTAAMMKETSVSGVCVASAFHYHLLQSGLIDRRFQNQREGNTTFLNSGSSWNPSKTFSITDLKQGLKESGIPCRFSQPERGKEL